ncbi:hypothetical protein NQD34_018426 [Periophthalmus magnuspinnatus]|nr:hypothetical protein NQD34_018426 [Periophthalmus magnuspinnatus]
MGIGLFTPLATRGAKTPKKIIEKCLTHTYIGLHSSNSHHTCDIRALIECTLIVIKLNSIAPPTLKVICKHYQIPTKFGESIGGIRRSKTLHYSHESFSTAGHQGHKYSKKTTTLKHV